MSYSDDRTQSKLNRIERDLSKLYKEAFEEMSSNADLYFSKYEKRWKQEYKAFQDGIYTETEFKNWELNQLARGDRWEAVRDDMARQMTRTNEIASAYINDKTPSIYSLNANFEAYQIAKDTGNLASAWNLIDEQTMKELVVNCGHIEFKTVRVNPVRDYEWNTKQIQRALNAGILQGKSITKMTESFLVVMQRNRTSAIRNARTAVTSAQNSGRLHAMESASDMGIKVKKRWIATLDARTRFSHALLNNQVREIYEDFSNGLQFPSDEKGAPAEVYNCRCGMTYFHDKYDKKPSNELWEELSDEERLKERERYEKWQAEQSQYHKSQQTNFDWSKKK